MPSRNTSSFVATVLSLVPATVLAHGESARGVGGVGTNTIGGDVESDVSISTRLDVREYSLFSDAALLDFQLDGEDVHQHARETSAFLAATFGVAPRLDLTLVLQANRFDDFADNSDAQALATGGISRTDVSQGLGDLLVMGRRQVFSRRNHHIALIGGVKLPTGNVRERTNVGDIVGTHNQPGSGSLDFQVGWGYSGKLGRLVMSADAIARVNTEGAGEFRSGNSLQSDVAVGMPLGPVSASIELNAFHQERDIERDAIKENSGVTSLFATPTLRTAFGQHGAFVAISYPLVQRFPGISNDEQIRVSAGYSFTFGGSDNQHEHGTHTHSHVASASPPVTTQSTVRRDQK